VTRNEVHKGDLPSGTGQVLVRLWRSGSVAFDFCITLFEIVCVRSGKDLAAFDGSFSGVAQMIRQAGIERPSNMTLLATNILLITGIAGFVCVSRRYMRFREADR